VYTCRPDEQLALGTFRLERAVVTQAEVWLTITYCSQKTHLLALN